MLFPLLIPLMAFLLCVQRKALLHMRLKLRNLTTQIRETLLEMPDRVFMKTMLDWITLAEEHLQYPDWSDEYRYALGFRVQSQETQTIYATFSLLHENEPNTVNVLWIEPGMTTLRNIVKNFTLEQFYRTVIPLASDALFDRAAQERWGPPPSSLNNGYEFLESLLRHLEAKVYRRTEQSHLSASQEAVSHHLMPNAQPDVMDRSGPGEYSLLRDRDPSTTRELLP